MTEPRHRLLQRQLARHLATEPALPPAVVALLREIDRAYHQSDDDRLLLERSLELVSEELIQRNEDVVLALESATAATFRYCELSDEMAWEGHPLPFAPGVRGRIAGPGELLFEPVLEDDRGGLRAALRAALANGAPFTTRFRVHGKAAAVRWLEARGQVRRAGVVSGICLDLTDEVHAEESQRRRLAALERQGRVLLQMARAMVGVGDSSLAYVRQLVENLAGTLGSARASVWIFDESGEKLRCLDLYLADEGAHCAGDELRRADFPLYFSRMEEQRIVAAVDAQRDPATRELTELYLAPLGITSVLDASIRVGGALTGVVRCENVGPSRAWSLDEQAFTASMADLVSQVLESERRATAETALAHQEQFLRQIVDLDPNLIFSKDRAGRFVFVNQATADVYGTTVSELLGKTDAHFNPNSSEVAQFLAQDLAVLDSGVELSIPESVITDATGRRRLLQTVKRPIFGAAGEATLVLGVSTDITARKEAEESRAELQQKLRQSQKLEAIGLLAGGVAHDFNNLLTPILLTAENLRGRFDPTSRDRSEIDDILSAAHAARDLTSQLLAFGRKQVLEMAVVDLNDELRRTTRLLGRLMPETVSVDMVLDSKPCRVRADPAQLQQVIVNLIINARDAMPRGGTIVLRTTHDSSRGVDGSLRAEVVLRVIDSGDGMDERVLSQLFEPFFTTKELGRGAGLGLSTAYGIIQQHQGSISVTSALGQGTSFEVRLPALAGTMAQGSAASAAIARPVADALGREADGAVILVVEDDAAVRRIVGKILADHGFDARVAADGEAALRLSLDHDGPIALLLTDVILPGMNGRALFEELVRSRPQMQVLYMSGYSQEVLGRQGVLEPDVNMLRKPFSPAELLGKVREMLRRSGPV